MVHGGSVGGPAATPGAGIGERMIHYLNVGAALVLLILALFGKRTPVFADVDQQKKAALGMLAASLSFLVIFLVWTSETAHFLEIFTYPIPPLLALMQSAWKADSKAPRAPDRSAAQSPLPMAKHKKGRSKPKAHHQTQ